MPRDLESEKETLEGLPPLTKEPEGGASGLDIQTGDNDDPGDRLMRDLKRENQRDRLHPYVNTLNLNDVESCVQLENTTFPPNEACSREKFIYRLTVCNELSLGLFTSTDDPNSPPRRSSTASTARPVESGAPERKEVLLAHIVATKSDHETIYDEDMALPPRWQEDRHADPNLGHKEQGRTIALHSLAVLPDFQSQGLGSTLLKAYIQRMQSAGIADRIALLAHKELIPFYENFGFKNLGESSAQYGGGGWYDMVRDIAPTPT